MHRVFGILIRFVLSLAAVGSGLAWGDESALPFRVGLGKCDITPDYPVRLSGFGFRRAESEGITQRIWAKAIAVDDGVHGPAVLITTDNLGVPDAIRREIEARLEKDAKLPRGRLTITASHTHTAPMLKGVCATLFGQPIPPDHQANIERYSTQFTDGLATAALQALANLEPAKLEWAIGQVAFAKNRRTAGGPVDHDLPTLIVRDRAGKLRAVLATYACHCVTLSHNRVSGDWAGYAQEEIEKQHPEAMALISIGCGADQNPNSGVTGDKIDIAAAQGREIAVEVDRLLQGTWRPLTGPLVVRSERFSLPFDTLPTREQWMTLAQRNDAIGYHAQVQLARLDRGEKLPESLDYSVQTWAFNKQLAMVFLPGEVVVDYALRLKRELDGTRVWIHAYANDAPCYIPSERILKEGGYEGGGAMVYYDRPTRLKTGLEQQIVDAVRRQLKDDFLAAWDPAKTRNSRPLSPQQSLACLKIRPELKAELVAAEPLVTDPVAIDFGPEGRLWVAEMHDYPLGLDGKYQPGGRVRVLRDTDGDGTFDHSSIFLEGLPFPTGITVWRRGVLVCAAPDIIYAEDTNGDERADVVKKLYSGFGTENYQARVNSLIYGLDGWVYGSCGLFGGEIQRFSGEPVKLGDRDFRIRPDTGEMEPATGRTQQGRVRDAWGNWFGCDNSTLCRHYPLPDHYLRRNPQVTLGETAVYVPDYPDSNRLFPIKQDAQRFKLSGNLGRATAACGLGIYRDDLLGESFQGNAFVCEPVNLVVHRLQLSPRESTFSGRRAPEEQESEFLASTDNWFRPVQVTTGPDGALWVVDMYRFVIEHPRWIPAEDLETLDVRAGQSMGRIYRIRPKDRPLRQPPDLTTLDAAGLVAALDSPNGWQRDLATQLLIWNREQDAVGPLTQLASSARRPEAKLHALLALEGLDKLTDELILQALSDENAGLRRHALRLAETRINQSAPVYDAAVRLVDDPDPQVRLQLACTSGAVESARSGEPLARLMQSHAEDAFLVAAVLSSTQRENLESFLTSLGSDWRSLPESLQGRLIALAVSTLEDRDALVKFVGEQIPDGEPGELTTVVRVLVPLLDAAQRRGATIEELLGPDLASRIGRLFELSRTTAIDENAKEADRVAAVGLLGRDGSNTQSDRESLLELLSPRTPTPLQSAAVRSLGRIRDDQTPDRLIESWGQLTPAMKTQVLDLLGSRPAWEQRLLAGVERGAIPAADFDAARKQRYLGSSNDEIRQRAERIFATAGTPDRQKVIDAYSSAAEMMGDAHRGRTLFAKHCASCHRLGDLGNVVGPDLAAQANKSSASLLVAMLDPSREVDSRYVTYNATTVDGRVLTGILAAESANSFTLKSQEGKQEILLRSDVDELRSTGKSLMPDGLERELAPTDVADILAFVRSSSAPAKSFPGNAPAVVQANGGIYELRAAVASIYGGDILFEMPFQNIGFWHGLDDHAAWSLEVDRSGTFDLYLDYACDEGSAGNLLEVEVARSFLKSAVAGTGGWDQYRQQKIGTVSLSEGTQRLVIRPSGPRLRGALLDLRGAYLVPAGQLWTLVAVAAKQEDPASLARQLLDDGRPADERAAMVAAHPGLAAELVRHMVADLKPGTPEEYRRIPWIWRVAIASGKRHEQEELRALLDVSLPQADAPLLDWQAVVLGGGIINGLSQADLWPRDWLHELLRDHASLRKRLDRAVQLASVMADNERVPTGTRYDAIRMLPLGTWEQCRPQLEKYVAKGTHAELQMGAVSGLADVDAPPVAVLLRDAAGYAPEGNRNLAIAALLRTPQRREVLSQAIKDGTIPREWLSEKQLDELTR